MAYGFGIIGCGMISRFHARAVNDVKGAKLVACFDSVAAAADKLANTPAICRRSYVHDTIVTAFEDGILERFAATMKGCRSQNRREQLLAQVVATAAV